MPKVKTQENRGEIIIYQTAKNEVKLDVRLEKETIWLNQSQIAVLLGVNQPAIAKHLINIFKDGELIEKSVHSILEYTASDGKIYKTKFYNLDVIISVGYRVNSKSATQFRIWATKILKQYITKGYAVNQKRLLEAQNKFKELQETINFLQQKSKNKNYLTLPHFLPKLKLAL